MEGITHLRLPTPTPFYVCTIREITVAVKKVAQNPAVLAN